MNLLDRARSIPEGIQAISEWLGDGAKVVDVEEAQTRANICLKCPKNIPGFKFREAVAEAVRRHIGVKNALQLRVKGEKGLGVCDACGCVLKLIIWQEGVRVRSQLTETEREKLPDYCWKLKT
jgi:hypothetical protein